jgi:pimeloyl-ACP methyl ester carboxylesterase
VVDHLLGDFRCLALDFWGHGRTPADGEPAFTTYLDEIDTVINHFGLPRDRLALVGSSFGGAVAVCYEAQRPGCKAIVGDDSMPSAGLLLLCATKGMASNDRPFVDAMPQRFPMVKVTWIDGEHGLNRQFPDLVARHIGDFLSAVE